MKGYELRESPLYYWAGGEQPVPDNVEVKITYRGRDGEITPAGSVDWLHAPPDASIDEEDLGSCLGDIIAFKLTGKVLCLS